MKGLWKWKILVVFFQTMVIVNLVELAIFSSYYFYFLLFLFAAFFSVMMCGVSSRQLQKEKNKFKEEKAKQIELAGCLGCQTIKERIHPEVPFCRVCLEKAFEEVVGLISEAETRIKLAQELGLENQAVGAKKWFEENLPEPMKWLFQQEALMYLKQYFPQIKPFDPSGFSGFPLNCDNPAVNIPVEGLELLKGMVQSNHLLPEFSKQ